MTHAWCTTCKQHGHCDIVRDALVTDGTPNAWKEFEGKLICTRWQDPVVAVRPIRETTQLNMFGEAKTNGTPWD